MKDAEAHYFSHDYDARDDEKMERLRLDMGWEGYGLAWAIIEKLYQAGGRISRDYNRIALSLPACPQPDSEKIKKLLECHRELFDSSTRNLIGSRSVDRRLGITKAKSEKARLAALLRHHGSIDADALRTHSGRNAVKKERKKERKKETEQPEFEAFWTAYPRKADKQGAFKSWNRIGLDATIIASIMAHVEAKSKSDSWLKDGGQYIPLPTTYLNQRRWEEQITIATRPTGTNSEYPKAMRGGVVVNNEDEELAQRRRQDEAVLRAQGR